MKVLNLRDVSKNTGVYIGRGSAWGNPFVIGVHGDRAEVIEKYRVYAYSKWVEDQEYGIDWLEPLKGENLVCFCAPLACHGDVLLEMIGESK